MTLSLINIISKYSHWNGLFRTVFFRTMLKSAIFSTPLMYIWLHDVHGSIRQYLDSIDSYFYSSFINKYRYVDEFNENSIKSLYDIWYSIISHGDTCITNVLPSVANIWYQTNFSTLDCFPYQFPKWYKIVLIIYKFK